MDLLYFGSLDLYLYGLSVVSFSTLKTIILQNLQILDEVEFLNSSISEKS